MGKGTVSRTGMMLCLGLSAEDGLGLFLARKVEIRLLNAGALVAQVGSSGVLDTNTLNLLSWVMESVWKWK